MKRYALVVLMCWIALGTAFAGGAQEVEPEATDDGYKQVSAKEVEVRWKVDDEHLMFEISAPTTGWVSIGFNPSRVMKDADFIFGFVQGSEVVVTDQFGNGTFSHIRDTEMGGSNDIVEFDGSESSGRTRISFTIPIDSGDQYDSVLTPGQEHTVLIAYGPDGADNFGKKHIERAQVKLKL